MPFHCVIFEFALDKVKTFFVVIRSLSSFPFFSRQLYLFILSLFIHGKKFQYNDYFPKNLKVLILTSY